MDISWNWLSERVELDDLDVETVGHRLTMAGLEVDGVETIGAGLEDVVVGRIDAIEENPEADNLVVCVVDAGEASTRRIVCGATNMQAGDRVPVALPGSRPPGVDFDITEREVMGRKSEGMLCSAEELDYAEASEGLWILPEDATVGRPVFRELELEDTVFDLDLTPNRADCFSHLGVAREVSSLFERELEMDRQRIETPPWASEGTGEAAESIASLEIEDPAGCPRYAFAIVEDVEIGPSPLWLRRRLKAIGVRPVNNVVDVTNYLLMDLGQPLHAFDLDELSGPEIRVRRARSDETIVGIDHDEYDLTTDDLVIADAERPVAIAGVMGGADTEVDQTTDRILLECATFDPKTVRRSASRFGLHTDASHRFERGVDPNLVEPALARAVSLIHKTQTERDGETSEPTVAAGIALSEVDGATDGWAIRLDTNRVRSVLGVDIDDTEIQEILEGLQMQVDEADQVDEEPGGDAEPSVYEVAVPTFRADVTRPVDIVEEVARVYGFDAVPETLPERTMGGAHEPRNAVDENDELEPTLVNPVERRRRHRIRHLLGDAGFHEAMNHSFMGAEQLDELRVPEEDSRREVVEIANPLRSDERYMRTTMVPSLLRNLRDNRAQDVRNVALFELGRVYRPDREWARLGLLAAGEAESNWDERRRWDFFDIKGVVEAIAEVCGVGAAADSAGQIDAWSEPDRHNPTLHPGVQAVWRPTGGRVLGEVGRLHPRIEGDLEIDGPVLVGEIDLEPLLKGPDEPSTVEELSAHPGVRRDMAVVLDDDVSYREVRSAIRAYTDQTDRFAELLDGVELFDVYRGEQVPDGARSLALSVRYRADDRTLTEDEVADLDDGLMAYLADELGAERR